MGFDYVVAAELAPEPEERSSVSAVVENGKEDAKDGAGESKEDAKHDAVECKEEAVAAVVDGDGGEGKGDVGGPEGTAEAAVR